MKQEINLDNPIFVYYLNIDGMSNQSVDEYIYKIQEFWSFQNIVTWIVPRREGETKIECVYDGRIKERGEELKELIEEINDKIEILSESGNFDDFKIAIREWRLSNILK
jgi:hypothetical protein